MFLKRVLKIVYSSFFYSLPNSLANIFVNDSDLTRTCRFFFFFFFFFFLWNLRLPSVYLTYGDCLENLFDFYKSCFITKKKKKKKKKSWYFETFCETLEIIKVILLLDKCSVIFYFFINISTFYLLGFYHFFTRNNNTSLMQLDECF